MIFVFVISNIAIIDNHTKKGDNISVVQDKLERKP